jgi:NDP-sugar pyrophosphorylase family protein
LSRAVDRPRTAVVLSGGEGIRLRPITKDLPKGLVKVGGKPLLHWVVEWLRTSGIRNVVMGVAYLKDQIIDYFGDGTSFGVDIRYSVHTVEGGTAEGFRLAIARHVDEDPFFALNGDQITDIKLAKMLHRHVTSKAMATIAVVHPRLPFGLVTVDRHNNCKGFLEKPVLKDRFISTGVYVFDKAIASYLPQQGDIERATFPKLTHQGKLAAYRHPGSFITVNSLRELEEAESALKENNLD